MTRCGVQGGGTAAHTHPEDLALRPKDHSFHALVALGFALMLSAYAFYAKIQLEAVVHDLHAVLNEQVPRVAEDISGIHGDLGRYFHGINASIAAVAAQSLGALGRVGALERYTRANAEGVKSQRAALMDGLNRTMANVDATLLGMNGVVVGTGIGTPGVATAHSGAAEPAVVGRAPGGGGVVNGGVPSGGFP